MLRRLLAASTSAWILAAAMPGTAHAQADGDPEVTPVKAAVAPSRAGSGQAVTAKVAIGGADYQLYLDPAAGVATAVPGRGAGGGGKTVHVAPTHASVADGAVTIDLLVNQRPRRVVIALDTPANHGASTGAEVGDAQSSASAPDLVPSTAAAADKAPVPPRLPPSRMAQLEQVNLHNVQASLTALGYDPGPIDGHWGPMSRDALKSFRSERGLPDREAPSHGDLAALQRALNELRAFAAGAGPLTGSAPADSPPPMVAHIDPARAVPGARPPREVTPVTSPTQPLARQGIRMSDAELASLLQNLKIDPDSDNAEVVIRLSEEGKKAGPAKSRMSLDVIDPRIGMLSAGVPEAPPETVDAAPPASAEPASPPLAKQLDFADWTARPFVEETRRAVQTIAEKPSEQAKILSRLAGVYLAHGRMDDTQELVSDLRRRGEATPLVAALADATAALKGNASPDAGLFKGTSPEARLWRAVDALYRGDVEGTARMNSLKGALADLPEALRFRIAEDAIGRLVEASRFAPAHDVMRMLESWSADRETADVLDYWRARELDIRGDKDKAKAIYGRLAQNRSEIGIRSRFHLVALSLPDAGPTAASGMADQLDELAATWPDAALDPSFYRLSIGALRKAGRTAEAVSRLDRLMQDPDQTVASWARDELRGLLNGLIDGSEPVSLPTRLALLSLSSRWAMRDPSLRPHLLEAAEFLARTGLTKRAAEMLAYAEAAADPAEKPVILMRRAALQVAAGDPKAAVTTLRGVAGLIPQASPLRAEWLARTADALTLSGKPDEAVALLGKEKQAVADRKVADAAMRAHIAADRWGWVAFQLAQEVPPRPELAAERLGENDLHDDVMRLASSYALAGQEDALEALGRDWRPVMDSTRHASSFAALTERTQASTVRDLLARADRLLEAKVR
ncbi:peptidoglycan-binding protein [Azospirillum sp. SYSU D00513]|uniref:peptidoglycan-binding protein n=1 Tax=Azospirillum sp. SYSU D00513 TaxID=2812561 RepID=UPI001A95CA88|nr:peptidoglycan-binding protein [Azospirillum sp. SYSU D00513]